MYNSDFHKDAYHYENYLPDLSGAKIKVLPTLDYQPETYTPFKSAFEILNEQPSKVPLDDLMQLKVGRTRDQVDLILDELSRRERVKYDNMCMIYRDLMDVYEAKIQLDPSHFYSKSQTWRDLFKQEMNLKQQIRSEIRDMYRDTTLAASALRDSLLEHKIESQKAKMFSIEDVINEDYEHLNSD